VEAKISEGGDFKNNDLHPIDFDRGGKRPYYTPPMAPALPDRVDCAHLADDAVVLERVYSLGEMPRLQDLLADPQGSVHASFSFAKVDSGRVGATVAIESVAQLVCQRCLQSFAYPLTGKSEIEFAGSSSPGAAESQREFYVMDEGSVSLRELAEEELLLALPIVAMHEPQACEQAVTEETDGEIHGMSDDRTRPFASLKTLLKKT
jgi:uncharacterized protein